MPSSIKDRFTVDFEYIFFFVKNKKYWFEMQVVPLAKSTSRDHRITKKDYTETRPNRLYPGPQQLGSGMLKPYGDFRNKRCIWKIPSTPFKEAHFAVFPDELVKIPIKAGCIPKGIVLDPFIGSGTVAVVAKGLNRQYIGIDLNPEYIKMAQKRIVNTQRSLF